MASFFLRFSTFPMKKVCILGGVVRFLGQVVGV